MHVTSAIRKSLLSLHVLASVGWAGALTVFLVHATAAWSSTEPHIIHAASLAMAASAWLVILPFSVVSLTSGIVVALASPWGLIRHYWVVFKLVLTVLATAVLFAKLDPINELALATAQDPFASLTSRRSLLLHAVGGLAILLIAALLAFFKPAGVTPWTRRTRANRFAGGTPGDINIQVRTPGWIKAAAAIGAVLLLLLLVMIAGGSHGPGMHG